MKQFLVVLLFLLIGFFVVPQTHAQTRYATCDLCGFCISPTPAPAGPPTYNTPPSNWTSCRSCLYPELGDVPAESLQTVQIDSQTGEPPHPQSGSYYTMIGCVGTNLQDGFRNKGAAGSVVNKLLGVVFSLSGGVAFLYLLYGAFLILTSQGDPGRLNRGKRTIYGALIGVIFVITSVFIVNLIGGQVLKIPGFTSTP